MDFRVGVIIFNYCQEYKWAKDSSLRGTTSGIWLQLTLEKFQGTTIIITIIIRMSFNVVPKVSGYFQLPTNVWKRHNQV